MVVALLSSLLSIPQGLDAAQRKAGNDASAMVPENGVQGAAPEAGPDDADQDPALASRSVPCRSSFAEADTKPC